MKQNRQKKYKILTSVIAVLYLLLTTNYLLVSAQEITQSVDLSISSIPLDPKAGETVTLQVESFGIDLSQAMLSWTYGGKPAGSGLGKTTISVVAPTSGNTTIAAVSVTGGGVTPISATLVLRPGSIDLLWEGVGSSVPPFYKGLPLLTPSGTFRVLAVPNGNAPKQSNFEWSRNDSALQDGSGISRQSLILQNTVFHKTDKIGVVVSGGLFQGGAVTAVPSRQPEAIAYQKKEGFVDYTRGFKTSATVVGTGAVLLFEPFFFSLPTGTSASDLSFTFMAGDQQLYQSPQNELRLARPEGESLRLNSRLAP